MGRVEALDLVLALAKVVSESAKASSLRFSQHDLQTNSPWLSYTSFAAKSWRQTEQAKSTPVAGIL